MPQVSYRGLTTQRVYSFGYALGATGFSAIPSQLQDAYGNPITTDTAISYNGELVVYVNRDGGIRRGVAGPQPADADANLGNADNVYNAYATPSAWEAG